MAILERKKLRDLGMFFKRSFKCFKNEKFNFIQVILKLECLLYHNIYIQGVYDKVALFEREQNLMALREKKFRHIIRKNKE